MKRLLEGLRRPSTLLPLLFMLVLGFLTATQFLSDSVLLIITASIAITVSSLILITYTPMLIYVLRSRGHRVEERNLFMAIIILFMAIAAWNVWRISFTVLDQPEWMIGHWFPSLLSLVGSMTGFYFLSAPDVSRIGWRYTTIAIILSSVLMAIGMFFI